MTKERKALKERKAEGEFYTPKWLVAAAERMIARNLGESWKDEYVIWDCAWGGGALTSFGGFREAYCSTLNQEDIDSNDCSGVTAFQYDFLEDGIGADGLNEEVILNDSKMPDGLKEVLLSKKKLLFLINPPYFSGGCMFQGKNKSLLDFKVNKVFNKVKEYKSALSRSYGCFMIRVLEYLKINPNISMGLFCTPIFLSGPSFDNFRSRFLGDFKYLDGALFPSNVFSDCSSLWGVTFNLWTPGVTEDKKNFPHLLLGGEEDVEKYL